MIGIELVKAFVTILIGAFVAYIAYQQWRVSSANLRERLFERRFKVFKETQTFLSVITRDATFSDKDLVEFHDAPQMARFLFDAELADYLKSIKRRASQLRRYQNNAKALQAGDERLKYLELQNNELKWLTNQVSEIFNKFEPYLGFKHHK